MNTVTIGEPCKDCDNPTIAVPGDWANYHRFCLFCMKSGIEFLTRERQRMEQRIEELERYVNAAHDDTEMTPEGD